MKCLIFISFLFFTQIYAEWIQGPNNYEYRIVVDPLVNHATAKDNCESLNSRLAILNEQEQLDFLLTSPNLSSSPSQFHYIDLLRVNNTSWRWADNSGFVHLGSEGFTGINGIFGERDCVMFVPETPRYYFDFPCLNGGQYICQRVPEQTTTEAPPITTTTLSTPTTEETVETTTTDNTITTTTSQSTTLELLSTEQTTTTLSTPTTEETNATTEEPLITTTSITTTGDGTTSTTETNTTETTTTTTTEQTIAAMTSQDSIMLYIIIGSAGGGGLLLIVVLVVVICCCCCKKGNTSDTEKLKEDSIKIKNTPPTDKMDEALDIKNEETTVSEKHIYEKRLEEADLYSSPIPKNKRGVASSKPAVEDQYSVPNKKVADENNLYTAMSDISFNSNRSTQRKLIRDFSFSSDDSFDDDVTVNDVTKSQPIADTTYELVDEPMPNSNAYHEVADIDGDVIIEEAYSGILGAEEPSYQEMASLYNNDAKNSSNYDSLNNSVRPVPSQRRKNNFTPE